MPLQMPPGPEDRRPGLEEALERCRRDAVLGRALDNCDRRMRAALDTLVRLEARALLVEEPEFPAALRDIPDPPTHLFLRGVPPAAGAPHVALVGTRHPGPSGRRFAEEAGEVLARHGVVVVSGLARGVDGLAHAGALRGALPGRCVTLAVIASGFDRCYPPEHAGLASRVLACGALLTEFPPGAPALRFHFIRRNRLLSGLARLLVVVEARRKSGALVTAEYALQQGREIGALPGDIYNPAAEGTNRLLFDGATPIVSPAALVQRLIELEMIVPERRRRRFAPRPAGLSAEAGRVWEELTRRPQAIDALAARTALQPGPLLGALLELELAGRLRRDPEGVSRQEDADGGGGPDRGSPPAAPAGGARRSPRDGECR